MYRRKDSPAGDVVRVASLLPWWASLLLAFISWAILHAIAGIQIETQPAVEGLFHCAGKQFWVTLAFYGQLILPVFFIFAAIKSAAQKMRSKGIAISIFFLLAVIFLCFLVTNRKVEEEWPAEELYGMDWEPFQFDIWKSGMDVDEIINIARNRDIPLGRKTVINFNEGFTERYILPHKDKETTYNYQTKLFGSKANVFLFLTEKGKKLMKLSIRWDTGEELFEPVKNLILEKSPVSEETDKSMMTIKTTYKINKNLVIEHEVMTNRVLTMTYNDLYLIQSDKNYKKALEEQSKKEAYRKDSGKF